jgi:type VI protein secretion system component Hcp
VTVDMFLKLKSPDVTGEATDTDHKGEIEIVSWS